MSGFAAVLQRDGAPVDRALLVRMAAPLVNVCADAYTATVAGPLGMVHAFLRTREGATAGPHRRGALCLVGDIRLDGRRRLAEAVRDAGVTTAGDHKGAATGRGAAIDADDDDALVLAAYAAWGEAAFARLRGEFAFALWDGASASLYCVRDGMGVRPLFFANLGRAFVCANSLEAVRAHPAVSSQLHDAALVSFLRWGWNVDVHRSAFADVQRLEAGHWLAATVERGASAPRRHWSFPTPSALRLRDEREYVDGYRAVLADAVRDRVRQPSMSIQFSGGLDSTSLAATARRALPDVAVKSFTYAATSLFDDQEGVVARAAAQQLGIAHEVDESPWQPLAHLESPAFHTPEPIDDADYPSTVASLQRMAAHSRVLFVGDDGDTLFAPPGLAGMARQWGWPETLGRAAAYAFRHRRLPVLGWHLRDRLRGRPIERVYDPPPPWIRADVLARTGAQDFVEPPRHPTRPGTKWLLGAFWQTGMETDSFAYVPVPMEWRWPLLDTRVIEYVLSIPPIPWCQRKELVRRAFAADLPAAVLQRPKTVLPPLPPLLAQRWVAAGRPGLSWLQGDVGLYVDGPLVRPILEGGDVAAIPLAWRALHLGQWLGSLGRRELLTNFDTLLHFK